MATDITAITAQIFKLLEPLQSDERKRIIKASLTLLGEEGNVEADASKKEEEQEGGNTSLPAKARTWMRTNGITQEQLGQVFHVEDGTVAIIAAEAPWPLPGLDDTDLSEPGSALELHRA
jgi:hypothetical protein